MAKQCFFSGVKRKVIEICQRIFRLKIFQPLNPGKKLSCLATEKQANCSILSHFDIIVKTLNFFKENI
jgi:hypothetical protein